MMLTHMCSLVWRELCQESAGLRGQAVKQVPAGQKDCSMIKTHKPELQPVWEIVAGRALVKQVPTGQKRFSTLTYEH